MNFVENDPIESVEGRRTRIDHVAENLSGHDDNRCIAIYCRVTSEETNSLLTVLLDEVVKFLVR